MTKSQIMAGLSALAFAAAALPASAHIVLAEPSAEVLRRFFRALRLGDK